MCDKCLKIVICEVKRVNDCDIKNFDVVVYNWSNIECYDLIELLIFDKDLFACYNLIIIWGDYLEDK